MATPFLELYDSLDVIGNGSFGIIRKVRRKTDGQFFARKELNFERMSERDRKQIVAEVNILKDLHHEHIVRYHDRYVDRDAGILYILMEYCGGGDLSSVIKQATRQNRPIPEDTIWNYFMQILLALNHCHHPNGHGRSSSGGSAAAFQEPSEGQRERRSQILHRDLKPDNVFLDDTNLVKLGDFGLSKALAHASFANTYVGTPYYMSPELMQEKAYDSKSDIWSLGCLIYELCALKPPFHEAKTHAELNIFIRNGRIPPLPKGYSQSLQSVIKAMLNLNPAMRPSAQQLLGHERLELVFKVSETEKMLNTVKMHKANVTAKEKEVIARENALKENEQHVEALLSQKDREINSLQHLITSLQTQSQHNAQYNSADVEEAIKDAVFRRESELRALVAQREDEVKEAIARREAELMDAMRRRETEVIQAWDAREHEIRTEVEEQIKQAEEQVQWVMQQQEDLQAEEQRLDGLRKELETKMQKWEAGSKGYKERAPLEEVKNLLEPLERAIVPSPRRPPSTPSVYSTPLSRPLKTAENVLQSAMKGVILTNTGETLATPGPLEIATIFNRSPKVGLNFGKIFDSPEDSTNTDDESDAEPLGEGAGDEESSLEDDPNPSPPPSPSSKRERERASQADQRPATGRPSSTRSSSVSSQAPTRLRRPSIRAESRSSVTIKASTSDPTNIASPSRKARTSVKASGGPTVRAVTMPTAPPKYDLADEENLPSPFLKRTDRAVPAPQAPPAPAANAKLKRPSNGNLLRAVAAANNAGRRGSVSSGGEAAQSSRPPVINARKATKTLSR